MARTKGVLGTGIRLADQMIVGYLALNCPLDRVRAVLEACGAQSKRRRGLPHDVLVYLVMCMCLYRNAAYEEVLSLVVEGLRQVYGDMIEATKVNKSAISLARTRVGAKSFETLYREQVKAVAPLQALGVAWRGYRVMALDGSTLELPDEIENAKYYGYPSASRGDVAFPQLRFCALAECGSHSLIGARMAPYSTGEQTLAHEVLSAASEEMLILADRGFAGWPLWQRGIATGAKLLIRARQSQVLPVIERLSDGSFISQLYESPKHRRQQCGCTIRVVEYKLDEGTEIYRLMTNLLDPTAAPADELATLYHRRWTVETALDELKSMLNDSRILRSKTPALVEQEFYALLTAHSAIRRLMTEAGVRTAQASEDLSFTHAVNVIRRRLPAQAALPP